MSAVYKNHTLPEHVDVLIVGAGLSGIGAARCLHVEQPELSFVLLEARSAIGGTWDLFRYPGIRSDSDMYSLSYDFKPWTAEESIAPGEQILDYLHETFDENRLSRELRLNRRVTRAEWSTPDAKWTVTVADTQNGASATMTARWIFHAGGYYQYAAGYTPNFVDQDVFKGIVVHPQAWPEDLDYADKKVVVIGSGATAVTLVPTIAKHAAHVTMLQRTPTYVMPVPGRDRLALALRRVLGDRRGYALARRKSMAQQRLIVRACHRFPNAARRFIRSVNVKLLPDDFDVDVHFNPPYNPWQQRMCAVPDGDLFTALSSRTASIVTGHIDRFSPTGVVLTTGEEIEADIVVTATGLQMQLFDGVELVVDGDTIELADRLTYKGMMLSDIPNLAYAFGGTMTWTMRISLVYRHFCRLLDHMRENGHDVCVARPSDPTISTKPLITLASGYFQRAADRMPRQGDRDPWLSTQDHWKADRRLLGSADVSHPELHFSRRTARVPAGTASRRIDRSDHTARRHLHSSPIPFARLGDPCQT